MSDVYAEALALWPEPFASEMARRERLIRADQGGQCEWCTDPRKFGRPHCAAHGNRD